MQIVIKKATIKGNLFLSYSFDQIDSDVKNRINTSSDAPIHDDLKNAFRKLIPHFAYMSEEIKDEKLIEKAIKNPDAFLFNRDEAKEETFFKFKCHQFEINEKDGYEKIIISGAKQLETLNEIYFSVPPVGLGDDAYQYHQDLQKVVEELKNEVAAYMQGKTAPKAQTDLFDDDFGDDTNTEEI